MPARVCPSARWFSRPLPALLAAIASPAFGQLVLPPIDGPAPTAPFKLPERPPTPPPVPTIGPAPLKQSTAVDLPDLKWESLVKKDAAGKVVRLKEPVEYASLRVNPTIDDATRAKLGPYMKERVALAERVAIENLDLMERWDGGLINTKNPMDKASGDLKAILDTSKPLTLPSIGSDLEKHGILTAVQRQFSAQKIVQEYNHAVLTELKGDTAKPGDKPADAPADKPADKPKDLDGALRTLRYMLAQATEETVHAYYGLLREARDRTAEVLPKSKLDSETQAKLSGAFRAIRGDADTQLDAMKKALADLTVDQRRDLFRAVVETRPQPAGAEKK